MQIHLSEHFTYGKLLRFTLPTIIMLIFTSIYGVVDGVFVSNFAGKSAFAAVNLIMPALMIFAAVGFMLGTGGSAVVARTMGEGDVPRANRYFSLIVAAGVLAGALFWGQRGRCWTWQSSTGEFSPLPWCPLFCRTCFKAFWWRRSGPSWAWGSP